MSLGYIDETCAEPEPIRAGVRTRMMAALNINPLGMLPKSPVNRISELGYILRYAISGAFSTKRRIAVNVNELADKWISAIVQMCLSHDKDGYDAADAKADKLLSPLLAAPVAQLREFYATLSAKMKAETRVPFLVWISFEAWGEAVIKNAPDEGVKRLKRKLAAEITDLAEAQVRDQFPEAIKRALMWRDEGTLKEVKSALQAGAKPSIKGRQSCLFLEMTHKKKKVSVMI